MSIDIKKTIPVSKIGIKDINQEMDNDIKTIPDSKIDTKA